jgi:molybdopterin synthase catalytic subunit
VGIGEESVHIAVSSPHRKSAWEAGEEALEEIKRKAEIWKMEVFQDGGVWRSNRDGEKGVRVEDPVEISK